MKLRGEGGVEGGELGEMARMGARDEISLGGNISGSLLIIIVISNVVVVLWGGVVEKIGRTAGGCGSK